MVDDDFLGAAVVSWLNVHAQLKVLDDKLYDAYYWGDKKATREKLNMIQF